MTVLAGAARRLLKTGGGPPAFGKRVKDKAWDKAAEIVAPALIRGGVARQQQVGGPPTTSITTRFTMFL